LLLTAPIHPSTLLIRPKVLPSASLPVLIYRFLRSSASLALLLEAATFFAIFIGVAKVAFNKKHQNFIAVRLMPLNSSEWLTLADDLL
jgi:hypothetical protein